MGRKILIVDDAEVNRAILHKMFEDEYEVLQAENGEMALEIMCANARDLSIVILDLKMPVMDGFSVLENAKRNPLLHTIPIVVATEYLNNENEMRALELGAADFITKPYNVAIIRQRVRNMIDMQESLSYKKISERDTLTGIYNRKRFYTRTYELLHENPNDDGVICCLNVDKFKVINDLFGTSEGDKLLIYIAQTIARKYGKSAVYGRLGADNFAICLKQHEEGMEAAMTEWINANIEKYPLEIRIVVRCGFYQVHDIDVPIEIMCDRANMAIMEIKGSYSCRFSVYNDKIRHKMLQEQEILNEMKQALDENQFLVYYQPKYNMETRKIIGSEALVRWLHPTKGIISPGVFIPVFEKNGFISSLDLYVWERTCQDLRDWMREGYMVCPVSVNVSRAELYNTNLCMMLENLIQKYSIPIHLLQLEITESAYTENPEQLIDSVNRLKSAGFRILMDDFGSGYSSLNTLKDVPVDVLKLDLKFLYNMDENIKANYILKSVVQMAKRLGLAVIAEGVETQQQAQFLLSIGCVRGQGYLYAKPMPKQQFTELIAEEGNVSEDDDDEVEGIVNIDDVMSRIHREDEVEWYRAAILQMHVTLIQYEVSNDVLTLFDLRSKESSKELFKMEIPNFKTVVKRGKYIHPSDVDRALHMMESRTDQTIRVRARHYHRGNGYVWCEVSGRWVYDESNEQTILNCVVRDLTDQKLNEAMLCLLNAFEQEEEEATIFRRVIPEIAECYILDGISLYVTAGYGAPKMSGFRWKRGSQLKKFYEDIPVSQEEINLLRDCVDENHVATFTRSSIDIPRSIRELAFCDGVKTVVMVDINLDEVYHGLLFYLSKDTEREYTKKELLAFSEISKCLSENMKRMTAEKRKWESLELYETSFQESSLRIWEYDILFKTLVSSKSAQKEIGYQEYTQEVPESQVQSGMIHEDYVAEYIRLYEKIRAGQNASALYKYMHPDGAYKWVRVEYTAILNDKGVPIKAIGFGEDVNTIYESQKRIRSDIRYRDKISRESVALFEVDLTEDKFIKVDREERSVFRNPRFSEGISQYAETYVLPEYREEFMMHFSLEALRREYRQGRQYVACIYQQKNPDGRVVWVESVSYLGFDSESNHITCFTYVRIIHEVMEWAKAAGVEMVVDELTSVMRKQEFEILVKYLLSTVNQDSKSVLLLVDMDEFASINEYFGKAYGDEVLANAASIIKATTPLHTVVGRIGADKFAIFIHGYSSKSEVVKMVQNLVRHLFTSFLKGRTVHQVTASVGIAFVDQCGTDYESLVLVAEEFMQHLKNRDRNLE